MLRKCIDCGLEAACKQDLDLFVSNKNCTHNKANLCKKCNLERAMNHRKLHPESRNKYDIKYRETHKEECRKRQRIWGKKNQPVKNAGTARYRAAKLQATPVWADAEIINDFYLEAKYHQLEVDHVIPLQGDLVCGLHVEHNLQLLSKKENVSKHNKKWPDQW